MIMPSARMIRVHRPFFVSAVFFMQLAVWGGVVGLIWNAQEILIGDLVAVVLVLTVITYVEWLLGWESHVRLSERGVRVVNGLRIHEFPWPALVDVGLFEGLEFHLRSGRVVRSLQFGRSLIGTRSHYPTYRQGCWTIARWWAQAIPQPPDSRQAETSRRDGDGSYRWWVRVPVVPFLASVAGYTVLAFAYGWATGLIGGG